ncbi:pyrroline-5-carboxylate reductase [Paenibacillus sp. MBLB4367]|uniref:pyrroline-5-carboxylate reductase n=1 Tax=Paenibacillus sp. MBLB4367 TaxID=3384767 RepID=UPI003908282F
MANNRLSAQKITFVGAGSITEAIVRGLVEQRIADPKHLFALNRSSRDRLDAMKKQYGIQACTLEEERECYETYIRDADVVVMAMKPKDVGQAVHALKPYLNANQLLVSVVAGLSMDTVARILQNGMPIVRTMPNTSSTLGLGATGMSFSPEASETHQAIAFEMFQAIGEVSVVAEEQLDTVTGLSGSGPAYIYYMMEAMIEAGVMGGLTFQDAHSLTVQTVLGAATMVKVTKEDPAELRRKVTSPNGTTQAALELMNENGFTEIVQRAVLRATERARELGDMISSDVANKTT